MLINLFVVPRQYPGRVQVTAGGFRMADRQWQKQCFSSTEFTAAFPGESDTQPEETADTVFFCGIL
eukprot:6207671-Karenia_brevis.AAC.1